MTKRRYQREGIPMKELTFVLLLSTTLLLTGCGRSSQERTASKPGTPTGAAPAVQGAASKGGETGDELSGGGLSRFSDAKIYCLGMLLYASKNQMLYPTNLDQTLPYLREAHQMPSGTNRFDILYQGSLQTLPRGTANGIVVLRSTAWQGEDGKRRRVCGFADGHCEVHAEAERNFDAWEKQHLAPR